jgi:hypothetical protein
VESKNELIALADRCYGDDPSRKMDWYLEEYHRLFGNWRDLPIRLLELGVQNGHSMLIWKEYFSEATIVGIDRDPRPARFPQDARFHFIQGGQDDPAILGQALAAAGAPFDIIIDDASHLGYLTACSFSHLFPRALKPQGIYVIEDICSAFKPAGDFDATDYAPAEIGLPGMPRIFPSHQHGMVGLIKQLFDHTMSRIVTGSYTHFGIERMTILANLAIFQKASSVPLPADFDPVGYLQLNPDVAAGGGDPVRHYLEFGWSEGRRFR